MPEVELVANVSLRPGIAPIKCLNNVEFDEADTILHNTEHPTGSSRTFERGDRIVMLL